MNSKQHIKTQFKFKQRYRKQKKQHIYEHLQTKPIESINSLSKIMKTNWNA